MHFCEQKEKFQVYERYCQNKPRSELLWRQCCDSPFFQVLFYTIQFRAGVICGYCQSPLSVFISLSLSLLQECQKKLEHKLGLDSYLLKPVQRLTKYQLLLKVLYVASVILKTHHAQVHKAFFYV